MYFTAIAPSVGSSATITFHSIRGIESTAEIHGTSYLASRDGNIFWQEVKVAHKGTSRYVSGSQTNSTNLYDPGVSFLCDIQANTYEIFEKYATTVDLVTGTKTTCSAKSNFTKRGTTRFPQESKYGGCPTFSASVDSVVGKEFSFISGPVGMTSASPQGSTTTTYETTSRSFLRIGHPAEITTPGFTFRAFETITHANWSSSSKNTDGQTFPVLSTKTTSVEVPYARLFSPEFLTYGSVTMAHLPGLPAFGAPTHADNNFKREAVAVLWIHPKSGGYSSHTLFPFQTKNNISTSSEFCSGTSTYLYNANTTKDAVKASTTLQTISISTRGVPRYENFVETFSQSETASDCLKSYSTSYTFGTKAPLLTFSVAAERARYGVLISSEFATRDVFKSPSGVDQAGASGTGVSVLPSFINISFNAVNAAGLHYPFVHGDPREFTVKTSTTARKSRTGLGATSSSYVTTTKRTFFSQWRSSSSRAFGGIQTFPWKPEYPIEAENGNRGLGATWASVSYIGSGITTGKIGAITPFYPQVYGAPQAMQFREESFHAEVAAGSAILGPLATDPELALVSVTFTNEYSKRDKTGRNATAKMTTTQATMEMVATWNSSKGSFYSSYPTSEFSVKTLVLGPQDNFSAFYDASAVSADGIAAGGVPVGRLGRVSWDAPNLSITQITALWPTFGSTTKTSVSFDTITQTTSYDWQAYHL